MRLDCLLQTGTILGLFVSSGIITQAAKWKPAAHNSDQGLHGFGMAHPGWEF